MTRSRILSWVIVIGAGIVTTLIVPQAASAWSLNQANANLARAVALPDDAPARAFALSSATQLLNDAREQWNNPRIALASARMSNEQGQPQRAVDTLETSGESLQGDFMAQFVWGNAEWQSAHPSAAFERWRNASALDFFMQAAHRAEFRLQWTQAEELARIAIGIAPNNAEAHLILADALSRQNIDNVEAWQELDRAAALTQDKEMLSTIFSRQGEVLAAQGKYRDAIEYYSRARTIAPTDARPRTDYALVLLKISPNATNEAEALLVKVIGDAPWYIDAYVALANIAENRSDAVGAEAWYQTGLQKNPNDARLLFPLGEFYARQNRLNEARTTLTLALKYEVRAAELQAITRALAKIKSP